MARRLSGEAVGFSIPLPSISSMIFAQHYELPAHGAEMVANTCIAAALAAVGVGGKAQETEHRKRHAQDWKYFCFHLNSGSTMFPDINTHELIRSLKEGRINRDGPWHESLKLFMAAWVACKTRKTFLASAAEGHTADLQMIRFGEGICSLEAPRQGNLNDLRKAPSGWLIRVESRIRAIAMATVGFVPKEFQGDCWVMSKESLTYPGLTNDMCRFTYLEIKDWNDAVTSGSGLIPPAPDLELPGAPPGKHPYQFALQGLFNYAQLMELVKPRTAKTLAFQSHRSPGKMAIIDEAASPQDIETAIRHALSR